MCYGGNDKNPVQVSAYLKNEAGWATKVTSITPGITATLPASNNDFYVYAKSATEYFIIENRQKTGRDVFLPDAGLAIWHIDEQGSNNNEQMTPSQHYECSLVQADNRFDLEKNRNGGDSQDLFGSPNNPQFSDSTSPNSKWWDGSDSGLKLTQISESGPTMTFATTMVTGWVNNKKVVETYSHVSTQSAFATLEGLGGRKQIAPTSPDGTSNVLRILKVAQANGRQVSVYIGSEGYIYAVYMTPE
jgi:hypothetical protein